jgi:RNA polymerase-associated protein
MSISLVNKRSVMTLFSANDLDSHAVRIALADKGVSYNVVSVDCDNKPEDLLDLNPYGSVPTLVDRELVLYKANIIMEYLDERFPHPPLLPIYPVSRAKSRLLMHRIDVEWYSLAKLLLDEKTSPEKKEVVRSELCNSLMNVAAVFESTPYFLSEEFTLVDCCMAPLLWRLSQMEISLTGRQGKLLMAYAERLFSRKSFQLSLSEIESEVNEFEESF